MDETSAPPSGGPNATEPIGAGASYVVSLPVFEGPLDLLLHLIQKHELDIFDIPVSFVTQKYLEYLSLMRELQIDVASEYLVMAATLAHIKSKTLLPVEATQQDEETDLEEEADPRAELIRRLLEYQKYKDAAGRLDERGALGRDVFLRGAPSVTADGPAPLAPVGVFNLLDAFAKVLERAQVKIEHEISFDRLTITERIQQLCERLAGRKSCRFEELFDGQRTRFDLIITFLAILEMTRLKLTRIFQADPLSEIFIELAASDSIPASVDEKPEDKEGVPSEAAQDQKSETEPKGEPDGETEPGPESELEPERDRVPEAELEPERDRVPEAELDREPEAELDRELEAELDREPEAELDRELEAEPDRELEAERPGEDERETEACVDSASPEDIIDSEEKPA